MFKRKFIDPFDNDLVNIAILVLSLLITAKVILLAIAFINWSITAEGIRGFIALTVLSAVCLFLMTKPRG
jgi:hypothetical protein